MLRRLDILTYLFFTTAKAFHLNSMHNHIYVYNGPGADDIGVEQTINCLRRNADSDYLISPISFEGIITGDWRGKTALLVIPGGAATPYCEYLNGKGNTQIRKYLESGGSYLGIGAGAYYGGSYVEFAKGTSLARSRQMELSLCPGIVEGPTLAEYSYDTKKGARAAAIHWNSHDNMPNFSDSIASIRANIYYNGGGHFKEADNCGNVKILATYADEDHSRKDRAESSGEAAEAHQEMVKSYDSLAAIVECDVGDGEVKGKAVLSGVHFEYDPFSAYFQGDASSPEGADPYLLKLRPKLEQSEPLRQQIIHKILKRLRITVRGEQQIFS